MYHIGTFDLQTLHIDARIENVCVQCIFAHKSTSPGCLLNICENGRSRTEILQRKGVVSDPTCTIKLDSSYSLLAQDIVNSTYWIVKVINNKILSYEPSVKGEFNLNTHNFCESQFYFIPESFTSTCDDHYANQGNHCCIYGKTVVNNFIITVL